MMPDRPAAAAADAPPLTLWLFPGASLMDFTWLSPGLAIVRCPGCGASQRYSITHVPEAFFHENDECPILKRIEWALALVRKETGVDLTKLFRRKP